MRSYRLLLCCLVLIAVCALPSMGQIGVGTRAIGMGGAFTAIADDASAPYWNPAGLVKVKRFTFQPPNVQLRIDTNLDWRDVIDNPPNDDAGRIDLLSKLGQDTTTVDMSVNMGFAMQGLAVSIMPTVEVELDAQGVTLDADGDPNGGTGTISGTGVAVGGISIARRLKDGSALGVTVKSVRGTQFTQTVDFTPDPVTGETPDPPDPVETDTSGLGIDVGYLRETSPDTSMGIMVRNLIEPGTPGDFSARTVNVGMAHRLSGGKVLLAADIASLFDRPHLNLGAELTTGKFLSLWGGIYERKPTLGLGINLLGLKAQFAYSPKNTSILSGSVFF